MLVRSSIFNKGRKSFGNTTAVQWVDNQVIIKSKISDPTNPNTPAQQLRRSIFTSLQRFGSSLLPFLQENFESSASNRSPYSSFMRSALLAYQGASSYDPQDFGEVEDIQVTNGSLQPVLFSAEDITVTPGATSGPFISLTIEIQFDPSVWWPNSDALDEIGLLLVNPDGNYFSINSNLSVRSDGNITDVQNALDDQRLFVCPVVTNSDGLISVQSAIMIRNAAGDWNPNITVM